MTSNFDELFGTETEKIGNEQKSAGKTRAELLHEARNECYAMVENACIDAISAPTKLTMLLDVESRFSLYSLNNNLLIYAQKPYAIRFKNFDGWKKEGGIVKAGSKAFMILEPHEYTGNDGEKHIAYNPKKVFDVSDVTFRDRDQTPEQPKPYDARALLTALLNNSSIPVRKAEPAKLPRLARKVPITIIKIIVYTTDKTAKGLHMLSPQLLWHLLMRRWQRHTAKTIAQTVVHFRHDALPMFFQKNMAFRQI